MEVEYGKTNSILIKGLPIISKTTCQVRHLMVGIITGITVVKETSGSIGLKITIQTTKTMMGLWTGHIS